MAKYISRKQWKIPAGKKTSFFKNFLGFRFFFSFYRVAYIFGLQTRSSDEKAVCPSISPSVRQTRELWQNGRNICPDFYTVRSFILVFDPLYLKCWVNCPYWIEIADFQPIFARSSSAVTYPLWLWHLAKKSSVNTNTKSTMRFPLSLRWSSCVPPKGSQKRKTANLIRLKSHFAWRKSATKFLCVKTVSGKVVRHSFIGLTSRAKMIGGATPSTWNFGSKWPRWSEIADFRFLHSLRLSRNI